MRANRRYRTWLWATSRRVQVEPELISSPTSMASSTKDIGDVIPVNYVDAADQGGYYGTAACILDPQACLLGFLSVTVCT